MLTKITNLTIRVKAQYLIGWVCMAVGIYGFVLFMLPAIYRLGVSFLLIGAGAVFLFLPTVLRKKTSASDTVNPPNGDVTNQAETDFIQRTDFVNVPAQTDPKGE